MWKDAEGAEADTEMNGCINRSTFPDLDSTIENHPKPSNLKTTLNNPTSPSPHQPSKMQPTTFLTTTIIAALALTVMAAPVQGT